MFRALFTALLFTSVHFAHAATMPAELEKALHSFNAEGTKTWGFTQTTTAADKVVVERYSPNRPAFARWLLIEKDHRAPSEQETKTYRDMMANKPREDTAPNVKNQIKPETCEPLSQDDTYALYRFRLKPGSEDDKSADHMAVDFTLHRPTGTITQAKLYSVETFSPMFGVTITELQTLITYSLPEGDRPTLLQKIAVRIRGRAMLIKSLDQDMTVEYSEFTPPAAIATPTPL